MITFFIALLLLFGLVYFGILFASAWFFVHPMRTPLYLSPEYLGHPQENVEFTDEEAQCLIRAWWVPHESPKFTVVVGHGFMMNRAELSPMVTKMTPLGGSCLFYDFPAHGASSGKKCGFGYREQSTVRAAVEFARSKNPQLPVVLMGSSMGAVASAFALGNDPGLANGLILDSAYDELSEAVNGWWYFLGGKRLSTIMKPALYFGTFLLGFNPNNIRVSDALKGLTKPTLILHGDKDTLAGTKCADSNLNALAGPKVLVWFPGRNHSEGRWLDSERYFTSITTFIQAHILRRPD
jgi:uncharacterized protein